MTDAQFTQLVLIPYAGTVGGKLNLERLMLTPLLQDEDEFFFDMLSVRINPMTDLLDDPSPPFMLYRANPDQEQNGVNPYAATSYGGSVVPSSVCAHPVVIKVAGSGARRFMFRPPPVYMCTILKHTTPRPTVTLRSEYPATSAASTAANLHSTRVSVAKSGLPEPHGPKEPFCVF
jgi:hypothetical protein